MSMRAPADRERIERFLTRLGALTRQPGRIYLVGGTTMVVLRGSVRRRSTWTSLSRLTIRRPSSMRFAASKMRSTSTSNSPLPATSSPLPAGWRERSIFVGRYGALDVFHFDLYSVALSKIERGTERDFQDVAALAQSDRIELASSTTPSAKSCRVSPQKVWRAWIQQYSRSITTTCARC